MRVTNITLGLLLTCLAMAVQAQMYKWVDEHGAVTYTNVPPPQANTRGKLELVVPGSAAVSTYSSKESLGKGISGNNERALQDRVAQLEQALEVERRARTLAGEMLAAKAAGDAQRRKELRERCLADRRVDCDRPDLDESISHVAVARAPQVIRQVIVQPVVIRNVAPARAANHPHPAHPHPDTRHHTPSHLTATLSTPPRTITIQVGQRWRY